MTTEGRSGVLLGVPLVAGSLAIVTACITVVFLSMRSVMDIGGFCAEGGPYSIAVHCPKGVPGLMMGGIWLGLIFVFAYVAMVRRQRAPNLTGLFWPALFLSLGWNFLQYGFNPPFEGGLAWGWLVPGVLFVLMGAIPLFFVVPMLLRGDGRPRNMLGTTLDEGAAAMRRAVRVHRTPREEARPPGLVDELERLARLHRRRSLTDAEYEAAKQRLLEGR